MTAMDNITEFMRQYKQGSVHIRCPHCDHLGTLSVGTVGESFSKQSAWVSLDFNHVGPMPKFHKAAQCNHCHMLFELADAVVRPQDLPQAEPPERQKRFNVDPKLFDLPTTNSQPRGYNED